MNSSSPSLPADGTEEEDSVSTSVLFTSALSNGFDLNLDERFDSISFSNHPRWVCFAGASQPPLITRRLSQLTLWQEKLKLLSREKGILEQGQVLKTAQTFEEAKHARRKDLNDRCSGAAGGIFKLRLCIITGAEETLGIRADIIGRSEIFCCCWI